MSSPYHVSQCAPTPHILSCDKASLEFHALSLITEALAHPQRAFLSAFVQKAVDRELATRFLLDVVVVEHDKAKVNEFLGDWIRLLRRGMFSLTSLSYTDYSNGTFNRLREFRPVA